MNILPCFSNKAFNLDFQSTTIYIIFKDPIINFTVFLHYLGIKLIYLSLNTIFVIVKVHFMRNNEFDNLNFDELINDLIRPKFSLKDIYMKRLEELKMSTTTSLDILQIQHRTLHGILDGTQKKVDFTALLNLSNFLKLSKEEVFSLYIDELKRNYTYEPTINPEKITFIKQYFDLIALKKDGVIDDINDFEEIETKLCSVLGISTIFEYSPPKKEAAFSSGKTNPKNELTRDLWIQRAKRTFDEINNPNDYQRNELIQFFPDIRWHSTNVEKGLDYVIKSLYKIGITVIYQPSLSSLHLRGATLSVNKKPCIVITDYVGFYATLWFALIHELFHVIFDWEEIQSKRYHISDDDSEDLGILEKENEANQFAREYLFAKKKSKEIKARIYEPDFITNYAKIHNVHPSLIYTFNAYDSSKNKNFWALARKKNPNLKSLLTVFKYNWNKPKPVIDLVKTLRLKYYN